MIHYSPYKDKCFSTKDIPFFHNGENSMMKIAILGFGTVGSGAYETALSAPGIEVKYVLARREIPGLAAEVVREFDTILADEEVAVVAECMGGIQPALDYVRAAMKRGKSVVTPNKNLVSAHMEELTALAEAEGVSFRYTSSAGGGIPWLFNLQRQARCDTITEISGIVNGTCNYILDRMHREGAEFDAVLRSAQELGYAERDPSADIEGADTCRKCVISADLAFGALLNEAEIPVFGIDAISAEDIAFLETQGLTCRLMMHAGRTQDRLYAYVEPTLLSQGALAASVPDNCNLISLTGEHAGPLSFYGQGAGKMPTGSSVIHDVLDIRDGIAFPKRTLTPTTVDNDSVRHRYYLRSEEGMRISEPMSVCEAHRLAQERSGTPFFMAGIKE